MKGDIPSPRAKGLLMRKRAKKTAEMLNVHAKRRAKERHGLEVDKELLQKLLKQIRYERHDILIGKQSQSRHMWAVQIGLEWYPVVYNTRLNTIATFLPKYCLSEYGGHIFGDRYLETEKS